MGCDSEDVTISVAQQVNLVAHFGEPPRLGQNADFLSPPTEGGLGV
jgi:hypothetical protein